VLPSASYKRSKDTRAFSHKEKSPDLLWGKTGAKEYYASTYFLPSPQGVKKRFVKRHVFKANADHSSAPFASSAIRQTRRGFYLVTHQAAV
jgi:hypothetical protein